ncbi:hypothetical protein BDV26DRAFT_232344 [Aspergillus bertholletiae]|uniref:Uncharacterized protein n=1 Tax=Aspergillus bertholletiae TaxID=1226010 RepID=A0A5N7B377_9EURO|nr:hypothetical protein BDV26DRAFT_232344 [Aspergillus bertholletiae]
MVVSNKSACSSLGSFFFLLLSFFLALFFFVQNTLLPASGMMFTVGFRSSGEWNELVGGATEGNIMETPLSHDTL